MATISDLQLGSPMSSAPPTKHEAAEGIATCFTQLTIAVTSKRRTRDDSDTMVLSAPFVHRRVAA